MSNDVEEFEDDDLLVLTDDKGNDITLEFVERITRDGKDYAIMIPVDDEENDDDVANVVIMSIEEDEDGDEAFVALEDEETLNEVFEIFKKRFHDRYEFE